MAQEKPETNTSARAGWRYEEAVEMVSSSLLHGPVNERRWARDMLEGKYKDGSSGLRC
jgi:hypothetical protein